jgi:hypothetical protein
MTVRIVRVTFEGYMRPVELDGRVVAILSQEWAAAGHWTIELLVESP